MKTPKIEIPMTATRCKILKAITEFIEREGFSPRIQEIADATGLSFGAVQANLLPLQVAGYISRRPGTARSIQVLKSEVPEGARA